MPFSLLRSSVRWAVLAAALCPAAAAQPDPLSAEGFAPLKAGLEVAVERHAAPLLAPAGHVPLSAALDLFRPAEAPSYAGSVAEAERAVLAARQRRALRDVGLKLQVSYLENVEEGVLDAEGILYKRRANAELQWDLLRGGLLESRLDAQQLALEAEQVEYAAEQDARAERQGAVHARIIQAFNAQTLPLLERRRALLNTLAPVLLELFKADYVPAERVLEATAALAEVDARVQTYRAYNGQVGNGQAGTARTASAQIGRSDGAPLAAFPLLEITAGQVEAALAGSTDGVLASAELAQLRLDEHPLRQVSLAPFVRYNLFHSPGAASEPLREYVSVGASVSVPLPFRVGADEDLLAAEALTLDAERNRVLAARREEAFNLYYEYREHVRQYVGLYGKALQAEAELARALRADAFADDLVPASPVRTLALADRLLAIRVEMLGVTRLAYLELLRLGERLEAGALTNLLRPFDRAALLPEPPGRAAYVWSATLSDRPVADVLAALRRHRIGEAYVSTGGQAALTDSARALVRAAAAEGRRVHLLLGSNAVVHARNVGRLHRLVEEARAVGAAGIHLDVEPHTFDDWDERRADYQARYLAMLRTARAAAEGAGLDLSAALPWHYDPAVLREAAALADEVTLMVYGRADAAFYLDKLDQAGLAGDSAFRLALRPADFQDVAQMEALVASLQADALAHRFAFHDLDDLQALAGAPTPTD